MKLYDCTTAPSPRRVRIFLAEKGITVPTVQVNLREREQFTPAFAALNPDLTVPVLELDDGTRITDPIGICTYFEEVQPSPPLMGTDPTSKAVVSSAQRWAEREGFYAMMEAFRNSTPAMKDRAIPGPVPFAQIPELAQRGLKRMELFFQGLDDRLGRSEFLAGDRYTMADITAQITVDWAGWIKLAPPESCTNVKRWHDAVSARPSAKA